VRSGWHFRTSRRIARELGYGDCAALWIGVGNAAVDLRYWRHDDAHGMTPMDARTALPALALDRAEANWRVWIERNERTARDWLTGTPNKPSGFYFLGMALHAVQDVESHMGMTIAEHARRYLKRDDPDVAGDALARGEVVTRQFLNAFRDTAPRSHRTGCRHPRALAYRAWLRPPDRAPIDADVAGYLWQGVKWLREEPPVVRWPPSLLERPAC
jgi:hypothetical protein